MDATQVAMAINNVVQHWLDGIINKREMRERINQAIDLYDERI